MGYKFISKATGADIPIGHGLELCTKKIDIIKVRSTRCDRDVVFVDTPGFDDINTDVEILEMLGGWLNKRYHTCRLLSESKTVTMLGCCPDTKTKLL